MSEEDMILEVALRKESVDRNINEEQTEQDASKSLSARRAWIEIHDLSFWQARSCVALRKESVDRNYYVALCC